MFIVRSRLLLLPLLAVLVAATPNDPNADALELNRQLLQKWKTDPEHYARLQRDWHDFWALPEAKRQQLRQLDHDFHQLDAKTQKRLWQAAQRYAAWLDHLPESDRRQIEQTPDTQERLTLIRTIRERQWIERLPRKVQEDLAKLPAEKRSAQIAVLRKQERQQRQRWSRPVKAKPRGK